MPDIDKGESKYNPSRVNRKNIFYAVTLCAIIGSAIWLKSCEQPGQPVHNSTASSVQVPTELHLQDTLPVQKN